jgi:hypothetical protein
MEPLEHKATRLRALNTLATPGLASSGSAAVPSRQISTSSVKPAAVKGEVRAKREKLQHMRALYGLDKQAAEARPNANAHSAVHVPTAGPDTDEPASPGVDDFELEADELYEWTLHLTDDMDGL